MDTQTADQGQQPQERLRSVIIMPYDAVCRGLIGELLARLERRGIALTLFKSYELMEHEVAAMFGGMSSAPAFPMWEPQFADGPSLLIVVDGEEIDEKLATLIGASRPYLAGTIRGDYAMFGEDLVIFYSGDSDLSPETLIELLFKDDELPDIAFADEG